MALGMSKSAAYRYLAALREAGVAETDGRRRGAARVAARGRQQRRPRRTPQPYTTIEALAQAVHDGLVDATDEQREVLEQAWQIAQPPGDSPSSRAAGGDGQ